MPAEWFDDLARRAATAEISRREALKTVGAGVFAATLLGATPPGFDASRLGLLPDAQASTRPTGCNWILGPACIGGVFAVAAGAVDVCFATVGKGRLCASALLSYHSAYQKCKDAFDCQCAGGQKPCYSNWNDFEGECCAADETCSPDGCDCTAPCTSHKYGFLGGPCVSDCLATETCCNGQCVDLYTDSSNCGKCGHSCASFDCDTWPCCEGVCGGTETNCSYCGQKCTCPSGYSPICYRCGCQCV